MKLEVGQRVKALPGKVFKRSRYGKIGFILPGDGIFCIGSGEPTGKNELVYLVSFENPKVSYVFSAAYLKAVRSAPKKPRRRSA